MHKQISIVLYKRLFLIIIKVLFLIYHLHVQNL